MINEYIKKALCFGTFDILHPGHVYFLKQAKKYGDFLITVIARDLTVKKVKNRLPRNNEKKRLHQIKKLNIADQIILGNEDDPYKIIKKIKPNIICLGYDQKIFTKNLALELRQAKIDCKIIRIKAYKPNIYKSSKLST